MEEMLDFVFRSTGDNNLEPRGMGGRLGQNSQQDWTIFNVTTFVECVDDKDESVFWVARKIGDEVQEKRVLHRL